MLNKEKLDRISLQIMNICITSSDPVNVCNELSALYPEAYATSTKAFMNDMIKAIKDGVRFDARGTYRDPQILILLADDESLQKTAVQHELFTLITLRNYWRMPTIFLSKRTMDTPFLTVNHIPRYTISAEELYT